MSLIRADKLLTDRGVTESRSAAAELIRNGRVLIDGKPVQKPATMTPQNAIIKIDDQCLKFVSRGALKLLHALSVFDFECAGKVALDCGASTGGFTDVLLRQGASRVYAIDVGYGQLHWSLRNDSRVIVMEKTNLRTMPHEAISEPVNIATLDMSFISLKLVLEKVRAILSENGEVIALVKPQFEAGKKCVGRGGVIRNSETHEKVLNDVGQGCVEYGFEIAGITASPITGAKGNREFLFHLKKGSGIFSGATVENIKKAINNDS
jgi:23S rRNA (cytidine1920-2'-O)/16S rRNA (cytidine1409-2'-O)-methyltransferase